MSTTPHILAMFVLEKQMKDSFIEARKQNFNETDEQASEAYKQYQQDVDNTMFEGLDYFK